MDKIESLDGHYFFERPERKPVSKKKLRGLKRFQSLLEGIKEAESAQGGPSGYGSEDLEELLDELHSSGDRLKESQTLENIRQYRQSVKDFLRYAVQHILGVEAKSSGKNILKRKRFTQIKIIDEKLEKLVAEVLQSQLEQIEILTRIDEINGLLVNLLS